MALLITGGAGYVGSHVTMELCAEDEEVIVLDDLSSGDVRFVPRTARFIEGDAGDRGLVGDLLREYCIDAIVHCAASTSVPESCARPLDYYANNTIVSHALLAEAVAAGVSHLIFSSTAAVYGPVDGAPVSEDDRIDPVTPYGASKAMTERMIEDAVAATPLEAIRLRYFNVVGADPAGRAGQSNPSCEAVMKRLARAALDLQPGFDLYGTDWPTPDGTAVRDFIHVSDLASAHVAALKLLRAGGASGVYNCGNGRGHSVREAIDAFRAVSGHDFEVRERPRRAGDLASVVADTTRFTQATDWVPRHTDLTSIVSHALDWERRENIPNEPIVIRRRTLPMTTDSLGIAIVGLGGGVATTVACGIELLRQGAIETDGLPLAEFGMADLVGYRDIHLAGWDVNPADLATAARTHRVMPEAQIAQAEEALSAIKPWEAVMDADYCRNVTGENVYRDNSRRALIERVQQNLRDFSGDVPSGRVVVVNLASTERVPDDAPCLSSLAAFERGLDENDPGISPSMVYAYAALDMGIPYGNFTPNVAAEIPALLELARERGVPVAGRDGKTGQTMMKTVLAPAFRARALTVEGWYSTNILGNRDGQALDDPASLESKLNTKGDVLNDMLGYPVEDHIVRIHYYPPRGDDKEAWDNIDVTGFLGQKMQVKVNFLCKDSILAAPLIIEIARCLDLAERRDEAGPVDALGVFFKAPMSSDGSAPEHAFFRQQAALEEWLHADAPEPAKAAPAKEAPARPAPELTPAE